MHLSTDNHIIDKILSSFLVNVLVIAFFALRFVQFSDIHAFAGNGRWQTYELAIDYSFGFVKRAILGSLVSILSDSSHIIFCLLCMPVPDSLCDLSCVLKQS